MVTHTVDTCSRSMKLKSIMDYTKKRLHNDIRCEAAMRYDVIRTKLLN